MTREIRSVIDLEDIIAVELECKNCHSIFTVPISQYKDNVSKCPQCQHSWFPTIRGEADMAVYQMVAFLKDVVSKAKSKDAPFGMAIRFRIKEDSGKS